MRIGTWNVEYAAGAEKNTKRTEIIRANPADRVKLGSVKFELGCSRD